MTVGKSTEKYLLKQNTKAAGADCGVYVYKL